MWVSVCKRWSVVCDLSSFFQQYELRRVGDDEMFCVALAMTENDEGTVEQMNQDKGSEGNQPVTRACHKQGNGKADSRRERRRRSLSPTVVVLRWLSLAR